MVLGTRQYTGVSPVFFCAKQVQTARVPQKPAVHALSDDAFEEPPLDPIERYQHYFGATQIIWL